MSTYQADHRFFRNIHDGILGNAVRQNTDRYQKRMSAFIERDLGFPLWETQKEIADSVDDHPSTTVRSAHAAGKGLALDTPIPTPEGWTTMGVLQPGDWVYAENGQPCTVTAVSAVKRIECYRITFSDGTGLTCDVDHLWRVLRFVPRRTLRQATRTGGPAVKDWRDYWDCTDVVRTPDLKGMLRTSYGQRDASIPVNRPLVTPEVDLPVPPYILGAWLGDGSTACAVITSEDVEVIDRIRDAGWEAWERPYQKGHGNARTYGIAPQKGQGLAALRAAGVLGNKHIPAAYQRASVAQRLDILRGLMDTDGSAHKRGGTATIDLCHEQLASDTAELIRGLGMLVNIKRGTVTFQGRQIVRWRMAFSPTMQVFGLARKAALCRTVGPQRARQTHRFITGVESVGSVPTRCISVDSPYRTYLAGEAMIPTHNSAIASRIVLAFLHTREPSVVITTAPTARQVQNVLWRYINTAVASAPSPLMGRSLQVRYEIAPDWYAIGFTGDTNGGSTMQGFHAADLLLVVDEAAGVAEAVFEEAESILTGSGARALYIGNPTSLSGTFRSAFHENSDLYNGIRISAYDTPNFTHYGITRDDMLTGLWQQKVTGPMPYPALIDPVWVNRQIRRHGPQSPYVLSRIDAEFPTDSGSTLIALSWIERAQENAGTLYDPSAPWYAGIDVARFGEDETSINLRHGDEDGPQDSWNGLSTTESASRIAHYIGEHGIKQDSIELRIDEIGVGGGLADMLKGNGWNVKMINVGRKSSDPKKWPNFRHEMWWQLRERFRDDRIAAMEPGRYRDADGLLWDGTMDEGAQAQLSDIKFRYDSGGKYTMPIIETKDEAKRRGRPSPDRAEAKAMAFCTPPRGEGRLHVGMGRAKEPGFDKGARRRRRP